MIVTFFINLKHIKYNYFRRTLMKEYMEACQVDLSLSFNLFVFLTLLIPKSSIISFLNILNSDLYYCNNCALQDRIGN